MPFEPMGYKPYDASQPDEDSPDDSEAQWLAEYNERLILTVQAINRLRLALSAKLTP